MRTNVSGRPLRLLGVLALIWTGLVLGISFLEAPVKFTAPSVTLPIGLDVGRHVFRALNRVELILGLMSLVLLWIARPPRRMWLGLGIAWFALFLQTVWLLPALDARAVLILAGGQPPASTVLHILYGMAEGMKVFALLAVGWLSFQGGTAPRQAPTSRLPRCVPKHLHAASASPVISHHKTSSAQS